MIAQTLSQIAATQTLIPILTCAGLVIFLSFFIGMLFWTTRSAGRPIYHAMSRIPLEGEAEGEQK